KFFLVDRRAAPIAMAWRHHDASVTDLFPKPSESNEQDAARLQEIAIPLHKPYNSVLYVAGLSLVWKEAGHVPILKGPKGEVLTMAEFLCLRDLHGCKVATEALLPPVLADEETKKRKAEAKEADKADDNDDIHTERVVSKKRAGGAGMPRKKRKMHVGATPVNADSEHVSSPTPINHSLPVVAPANEEHVSETTSDARLAAL
ncbi:hypothetical protein Tco_0379455, partial [Tanacetum coccineum]